MTSHVNQVIKVTIKGDTDIEIVEPEKRIEITKDRTDEPNEAIVEIYNLNEDTRKAVKAAADRYTPIEIAVSRLYSADPILAYVGEIETVVNRNLRPGFMTRILALSEKRVHRAAYVTRKTWAKGTPKSDIVQELTDAIGLPVESDTIPTTGILLAMTASGPAFTVLRGFVRDMGMFCWIDDGALKISNVYAPPNPVVIEITDEMLIADPQETTRNDAAETSIQTITEMTGVDPFKRERRRRKRTTTKKELGENDYVEIEAVDIVVPGVELECYAIPNLKPDHIITYDGGVTHFRVYECELYGDDMRGGERPTSRIKADQFDGGVEP